MTDQPHDNEARVVIQADRDAAAKLRRRHGITNVDYNRYVRGVYDASYEVQAFAAHRIAVSTPAPAAQDAREAIAGLLARLDDWAPGVTAVRKDCLEAASAIRELLVALARSDSARAEGLSNGGEGLSSPAPTASGGGEWDGWVPLVFYDASDPARRIADLAEAFKQGNGRASVVGWQRLIADLNTTLAQSATREDGEPTEAMVDRAAQHLRETQQAGKRLTPWDSTPKATKRKWVELAWGTLRAAL